MNVGAFNSEDLEKLKSTNKCSECDLQSADLTGFNLSGVLRLSIYHEAQRGKGGDRWVEKEILNIEDYQPGGEKAFQLRSYSITVPEGIGWLRSVIGCGTS